MTDESNKVVEDHPKEMVLVRTGSVVPVFPDGSPGEFVSSSEPKSTALSLHLWALAWMAQAREAARAEVYRQVIAWCDAPPLDDADAGATVAEAAARDALRDARREAAQAGYAEGQKAARAEVLAEVEALLSQSRATVAQGEEERGRLVAQLDALARAIDDETRRAVTLHRLAAHLRGTP